MDDLYKSIFELEKLFLDNNANNLSLIRSHILEILLDLSVQPYYNETIIKFPSLLLSISKSIKEEELSVKSLLVLLNTIQNEQISQVLAEKGLLGFLIERIYMTMKIIDDKHLSITESLLVSDSSKDINGLKEFNELTFSENKIKLNLVGLLREREQIKLSLKIISNFY